MKWIGVFFLVVVCGSIGRLLDDRDLFWIGAPFELASLYGIVWVGGWLERCRANGEPQE